MAGRTIFQAGMLVATCLLVTADAKEIISDETRQEIAAMGDNVARIVEYLTAGPGRHQAYNRLSAFTDKIGHRLAGSKAMVQAVDYMLSALKNDGLDNVHTEDADVPNWVRGKESATLLEPREQNLAMLGLGTSIGTPTEGITADVLVVRTFDELHNRSSEAAGKIVVFNQAWVNYNASLVYRMYGASEAAKVGGLAALIRSITPFSINSPHTGLQEYEDGVKKIPAACITVEDAEMLSRMHARGTKIRINLKMGAQNLGLVTSQNTIAEIRGSKYPDEVVLVSGHLDSWDVGQGAMDDGGGAVVSWQALSVLRQLGLRPKRTVRAVLWTGEEFRGYGSQAYYNDHKHEASKMNIVMESDIGTFKPVGLSFTGSTEAKAIIIEMMKYMKPYNASRVTDGAVGLDISWWFVSGVPAGGLIDNEDKYFYFHHSNGDTMTVQDPDKMDQCAIMWTVLAYCLSEMEEMLPR